MTALVKSIHPDLVSDIALTSSFGHSLFPRGAMLSGHLQESKDPGHFVGKGWLQIEFDRIILPGAEVLPLEAKIIAAAPVLKQAGGHP